MAESSIKRLTSCKAKISDITNGEFIRMEGWEPSYILTPSNKRISRINIIAVVISLSKESGSIQIDDGTSSIGLRFFGENHFPDELNIGDIVMIVGRIRKYNEEIFIAPEIIKKLNDNRWIDVRKLELYLQELEEGEGKITIAQTVQTNDDSPYETKLSPKEETAKPQDDENASPANKIFALIKKLDTGKGADSEDIIAKSGIPNSEKIIQNLLEEGEIFEIRPGKLKVLE